MTVEGRMWELSAYADAGGAMIAVPDGIEVTATFGAGIVAGRSACNRYSGPCTWDGDHLRVGPLAATMMACPEPHMAIERAFHDALGRAARAVVHGPGLVLLDGAARVLLEFHEAVATPLLETSWEATGINNGRGGVESLVAGTEVTAVFADDGRVAGSAGCNRWTASFVVGGATMTIGPPAATRRLCGGPAGILEQEASFLAALSRTTRFAIDGDRLELRDEHDALQVSFRGASLSTSEA